MATWVAAIFFFVFVFFFGKEIAINNWEKKNHKLKKGSSRHNNSHPAAGQETNSFLRVA